MEGIFASPDFYWYPDLNKLDYVVQVGMVPLSMRKIFIITSVLAGIYSNAQDSIHFSGYTEAYYQFDFNQPEDHQRPAFIFSHNRHHEFNINLVFIKLNYSTPFIRSNLALASGTYVNANYSSEPGIYRNIFEANAGIKIGKKNLWFDVGIFPSHIGFESAISKDCWNVTRSLLAENSPYYESGAKLSFTSTGGKWILSLLGLNGWQRITRTDGNSMLSFGSQIQFRNSEKLLLNWSSFIGTDRPDSVRLKRFFNNFYAVSNLSSKFATTIGFDIGIEDERPDSRKKNIWYSPVFILKYTLSKSWATSFRAEYYEDRNSVIIVTGNAKGFRVAGVSMNLDYLPVRNAMVRLELRDLMSRDSIFSKKNARVKTDFLSLHHWQYHSKNVNCRLGSLLKSKLVKSFWKEN